MGAKSTALCLMAGLMLGTACQSKSASEEAAAQAQDDKDHKAYVEGLALKEFGARKTLENFGQTLAERYGLPPVITSRDTVSFGGPKDHIRLMVLQKPAAESQSLTIFHGDEKRLHLPLESNHKILASVHGDTVVRYRGLDGKVGPAWLPDTKTELFTVMGQAVDVPRGEGKALIAAQDDGTVIISDGPGAYRIFGSNQQVKAQVQLPDVAPATASKRGAARSKTYFYPRQNLVVVKDFKGPANHRGQRTKSGLRLFSLDTGKLQGTYPAGIEVYAGYDDPEHFMMLQKPGKLVFFEKGKPIRDVLMPAKGDIAMSPWNRYFTITAPDNRLWLGKTDTMDLIWEHTSPEPWNRFLASETRVADSGQVFAMRSEISSAGIPQQLQIFSIDPEGAGIVLLERPYQDSSLPPVWIAGITDEGSQVALGALGEEIRILDLPSLR